MRFNFLLAVSFFLWLTVDPENRSNIFLRNGVISQTIVVFKRHISWYSGITYCQGSCRQLTEVYFAKIGSKGTRDDHFKNKFASSLYMMQLQHPCLLLPHFTARKSSAASLLRQLPPLYTSNFFPSFLSPPNLLVTSAILQQLKSGK